MLTENSSSLCSVYCSYFRALVKNIIFSSPGENKCYQIREPAWFASKVIRSLFRSTAFSLIKYNNRMILYYTTYMGNRRFRTIRYNTFITRTEYNIFSYVTERNIIENYDNNHRACAKRIWDLFKTTSSIVSVVFNTILVPIADDGVRRSCPSLPPRVSAPQRTRKMHNIRNEQQLLARAN